MILENNNRIFYRIFIVASLIQNVHKKQQLWQFRYIGKYSLVILGFEKRELSLLPLVYNIVLNPKQ